MQFSPDGQWFWDGAQWRPAYSPDRAWRWDGTRWVPAGPALPQRWRYEPTEWTRRLQVILLALTVLGVVSSALFLPTVMNSMFQQAIDNALAQQPADSTVDPAQFRQFMAEFMYGTLVVAGVGAVVWLVVIVIGILKLWRWVYWYTVVVYLVSVLSVPQNVLYTLGIGPFRLPAWWLAVVLPATAVQVALAAWMIVLYRRYGTWARRRLPA